MKWLKLDCDFRNDPKIQALAREWGGQEAAGFWTLLLTFVGAHGGSECRVTIDPAGEFSPQYVAKWFGTYPQQIIKRLERAAELSLIEMEKSWTKVPSTSEVLPTVVASTREVLPTVVELSYTISIPNMLKRVDAYSQRVRTRAEKCTAKHALEEEVEEERIRKRNTPATPVADGFDEFWKVYPVRTEKLEARRVWNKLRPSMELQKTIVEAVGRQKASAEWLKENGRFIPNPAKWLRRGNWANEPKLIAVAKAGVVF